MSKPYIIRDWMTPNPITITPKTTLDQAHNLINKHRIRRLPVMDGDQLVGLVSWGDIREARPSDAASVNIFEIYHLLSRMTVDRIMSTDIVTIGSDEPIGAAAKIMHEKRFASLPVLEDGKLIGLITISDILRMVMEVTGHDQ